MFVKYRPIRPSDLPECVDCVPNASTIGGEERKALLTFWLELLGRGSASGAVMEDASGGGSILWFSLKVFIGSGYATHLKTEAAPFVDREVMRSWVKGDCPCLSEPEIRRANSTTGVTILMLAAGSPSRYDTADELRSLSDRVVDFARYCSGGYRCNELLQEFHDDDACAWASGAGFRLRTDYPRHYTAGDPTDGRRRARLYGVTAAEAAASAGTLVSTIFSYEEPRFFFRPNEQDLLLEALVGETDEALAESLGIALVTVRKRWESIYEKVESRRPEILVDGKAVDRSRGTEKKRRLLGYLRQHPEELRPCEPEGVTLPNGQISLRLGPKAPEAAGATSQ